MRFVKRNVNPNPIFDNGLSIREYAMMVGFIPLHIMAIPSLMRLLFGESTDVVTLSFVSYAVSTVVMIAVGFRLLRRDYDVLYDNMLRIVLEILGAYFAMMAMNMIVVMVIQTINPVGNLNNAEVVSMTGEHYGMTAAMTMYLAPIAEEIMFRAGLFGFFARKNRMAGYAISILAFSLYHVWAYAVADPSYLVYMLQYVPVSFLLCFVYERTRSIWSSILFHMMVNSIALSALEALESLI